MIRAMELAQALLLPLGSLLIAFGSVGAWLGRVRHHAHRVMAAGIAVASLGMVARWVVTGHPPMFGTFENSLCAAWFVAVASYVSGSPRFGAWLPKDLPRALGLWTLPLLAVGQFAQRTPYPLTISERSLIIDLHVVFAWSAQTVLLAATTAAIVVVFRRHRGDEALWQDLMMRGTGFGFVLLTAMIVVGSAYSFLLFSDWYRWEIVEAFAAVAWLAYGVCIHAAMMFGWRDRRLAVALLVASVFMLGTFWVWAFWPNTYHHFDIQAIRAE